MYRLKKGVADFTVVDGPFERRSYKAGEIYDEMDIPPQEKTKFEMIEPAAESSKLKAEGSKRGGK